MTTSTKKHNTVWRFMLWGWLILFVIAISGYYIPATIWWLPTFIGIAFIPLAFVGCLLLIAALFYHKKSLWIVVPALLLSLPLLKNAFAINTNAPYKENKSAGSIRVMQFNAKGLNGVDPRDSKLKVERAAFTQAINKYQPDIICMQEFANIQDTIILSNINLLRDTLGYEHVMFQPISYVRRPWGMQASGTVIFSKIAFVSRGSIPLSKKKYPEVLVYADVKVSDQTIRIGTAHFQSMHINWEIDDNSIPYYLKEDSLYLSNSFFVTRMRYFQKEHVSQSVAIRHFSDSSSLPVILCVDMNALPTSWVYEHTKESMQDAFLHQNWGIGNTYTHWPGFLRIDYIMAHEPLKSTQCKVLPLTISDHHALICDWQLPTIASASN